jgi:hypothetical protein
MVSFVKSNFINIRNKYLVRLNESMRELEQLRSKPELTVATLLALIYAHKQHKTPGMYFEFISKI